MIIGLGTDFWGNAIYVLPENMNRIDAEFIDHSFKILPVILSLAGATCSFLLYTFGSRLLFQTKISFLGKKIFKSCLKHPNQILKPKKIQASGSSCSTFSFSHPSSLFFLTPTTYSKWVKIGQQGVKICKMMWDWINILGGIIFEKKNFL